MKWRSRPLYLYQEPSSVSLITATLGEDDDNHDYYDDSDDAKTVSESLEKGCTFIPLFNWEDLTLYSCTASSRLVHYVSCWIFASETYYNGERKKQVGLKWRLGSFSIFSVFFINCNELLKNHSFLLQNLFWKRFKNKPPNKHCFCN
jgi:hypothetical protein